MRPEERRQLAVDLFNHAWSLLRLPERTGEQDDELIHAAHASRYHAGRCLTWCESEPAALEDWDLPFAHEALARANLVAGNEAEARRHAARARELAAQVADAEDRELLGADLASLP